MSGMLKKYQEIYIEALLKTLRKAPNCKIWTLAELAFEINKKIKTSIRIQKYTIPILLRCQHQFYTFKHQQAYAGGNKYIFIPINNFWSRENAKIAREAEDLNTSRFL